MRVVVRAPAIDVAIVDHLPTRLNEG